MRHTTAVERPGPQGTWRVALLLAAVSVIAIGGVLRLLDARLSAPGGNGRTYGIVAFEFAGFTGDAQTIIEAWSDPARRRAAELSLAIDSVLFIGAYVIFGLFLLRAALPPRPGGGGGLRRGLSAGVVAAGALDLVENYFLYAQLAAGRGDATQALVAAIAATLKFGLLLVALASAVIVLLGRWRHTRREGLSSLNQLN